MASGKLRLDAALLAGGFFETVEKAARAVMAGEVFVDGQAVSKPGTPVARDAALTLAARDKFVGRGGLKLEAALDHFGVSPAGLVAADIGASTGGFTDCLLQRGSIMVHAVDVGRGQLHWRLRQDPRVRIREGVNARFLMPEDLSPQPSLAVGDVSFISLTVILPAVFRLLPPSADAIFLIKPQFEAPRGSVAPGGVLRNDDLRRACVQKIRDFTERTGHVWIGHIESPITGRDGNVEYLAHMKRSAAVA